MSITVGVDPVTFNIARVLTSAVFAGIGGVVVLVAGEKFKIPKRLLRLLVAVAALGAAIGTFYAGWASIKLSLGFGIGMAILGASMAFEKAAASKGAARLGGALALLATGTAWVAWNAYSMFR